MVVVRVKVEPIVPLAMGVTEAGAKLQTTVAFTGAIAQLNPTAELKPFNEVTVILDTPPFPAITVDDAGDALKLKSFTVNV